jgi:hypothetical protein
LKATTAPPEAAEKRQFLVYLEPELIRRTKIYAIERGMTASGVVQQALLEFLTRKGGGESASDPNDSAPGR